MQGGNSVVIGNAHLHQYMYSLSAEVSSFIHRNAADPRLVGLNTPVHPFQPGNCPRKHAKASVYSQSKTHFPRIKAATAPPSSETETLSVSTSFPQTSVQETLPVPASKSETSLVPEPSPRTVPGIPKGPRKAEENFKWKVEPLEKKKTP